MHVCTGKRAARLPLQQGMHARRDWHPGGLQGCSPCLCNSRDEGMPACAHSSPKRWSSPGRGTGIVTAGNLDAITALAAELLHADWRIRCCSAVQVGMSCQRRRACTVSSPLGTAKLDRTPIGRVLTCCHVIGTERPALGNIARVPQRLCLGRQGLWHATLLLNQSPLALGSLSAVGPAGQLCRLGDGRQAKLAGLAEPWLVCGASLGTASCLADNHHLIARSFPHLQLLQPVQGVCCQTAVHSWAGAIGRSADEVEVEFCSE